MPSLSDAVIAISKIKLHNVVANVGTNYYLADCTETEQGYEYSVPLPRRTNKYYIHIYYDKQHKKSLLI